MVNTEKEFMTMGRAVTCPQCQKTSYLYPKATGMQPYLWEMNCSKCHLFNLGIDVYAPDHKNIAEQLEQLRDEFILGAKPLQIQTAIQNLAKKFDHLLSNKGCECDGTMSIAAKPRCMHCGTVVIDSYFHYVDEEPEPV